LLFCFFFSHCCSKTDTKVTPTWKSTIFTGCLGFKHITRWLAQNQIKKINTHFHPL
jgi:hypothetical protein